MMAAKMTFEGVMQFIVENELTDSVMLSLHPESFDKVALDYISIYESIQRPFEILGITIEEDSTGAIPRNHIGVIEI